MEKPFSLEFNVAVMTMANRVCPCGYDVSGVDDFCQAPSSLSELNDCIAATRRIVVSGAHSENTIFGCPEHNWAFRAWHDWTHWRIQAEFDLEGEVRVAERQVHDLGLVFGKRFAKDFKPIIYAEVVGQALYKELHGGYPANQRGFDAEFLDTMGGFHLFARRPNPLYEGLIELRRDSPLLAALAA